MENLKNNIDLLKNTYRDKNGCIVFFAGAGASIALGFKGWEDLLVEMGQKFKTKLP